MREAERDELERQIKATQETLAPKKKGAEKAVREAERVEREREAKVREAERLVREREGGKGDEVEMRGRWWRAVEGGVRGLVEG